MFRIGELDDTIHSTLSSSSMGLLDSNIDAMSMKKEKSEIDFFQEASVFGSFDPDDPDFSAPYSSGHNFVNCNSSNNLFNWANNRLSNHGNSLSSRPSSRQSLGRNSSSNSLKRTKSTNSMSCSRFYIGTSQSGSGSIVGSNISSCESLSTLLSRDLRFQKTKSNSHKMVFSLSDNNFQESVGTISPTISTTPLTLNSYIQSSCEQNITNRLRHRPYLETCFSCGVRWDLQQFTFDCGECGGYALERKDCPICSGECDSVWERDILASHDSKKAKWKGVCNLKNVHRDLSSTNDNFDRLAKENSD